MWSSIIIPSSMLGIMRIIFIKVLCMLEMNIYISVIGYNVLSKHIQFCFVFPTHIHYFRVVTSIVYIFTLLLYLWSITQRIIVDSFISPWSLLTLCLINSKFIRIFVSLSWNECCNFVIYHSNNTFCLKV